MQSALKDITVLITTIVLLAYSTGQRERLWKQIAAVRQIALAEAKFDWGCLSIFNKSAGFAR
jgi:hypothetical protein